MSNLSATDVAAWLLCAVAFAFGAWGLSVGWNNGIFDVHAWRQSHTAMSAYEMAVRHGPFWAYRTPIFGPPWQWPLELPLYQWLVAQAAVRLPIDLDRAGRAVSVLFYVAAFVPGWYVLELFEIAPRHRPVALAMVWASPLYIFWSRTFMIESTAICLAIAYLAIVHRATRPDRAAVSTPLLMAAAVIGALAGAVKVTAFAAFITIAAGLLVLRWRRAGWPRRAAAAALVLALMVPVAATAAWLAYADHLKTRSPLASEMNFTAEREQRFGTLAERFAPRSWYAVPANAILGRTRHAVIGSGVVFALALAATLWRRRRFLACVACLGAYFLPIAIFIRPFNVHVYYAYENGLLLAVVVGCGIVSCLEQPRHWARLAGVALFAAALAAMSTNYLSGYYVDQASGDLSPATIGVLTRARTVPADVMLIYGLSYSPVIPYASERRAVMDARDRSIDDPAIKAALDQLAAAGGRIGAVVACGDSRQGDAVRANIRRLGFPERPFHTEPYCDLYLRQ